MPLVEPAMLPIPITELIEFFGKLSDTVVNRFALQAWWARSGKA